MSEPTTRTETNPTDSEPPASQDAAAASDVGGPPLPTATDGGRPDAEPEADVAAAGLAGSELPDDEASNRVSHDRVSDGLVSDDRAGVDTDADVVEAAAGSSADPSGSGGPTSGTDLADASEGDDAAVADGAAVADDATESAGSDEDVEAADVDPEDAPISGEALLVQEGEIAGDYLEQLLDILDYDGDIDLDVEGSRAIVAIVGADDLDPLVGARGVTLDALQELTRLTVAQQTGVRTRLMLDVGGYRAGRRTELSALAASSVSRVIDTGEMLRMTSMNAFERKIVHDVVTATDGVRSESEGEEPDRRVVILPDR